MGEFDQIESSPEDDQDTQESEDSETEYSSSSESTASERARCKTPSLTDSHNQSESAVGFNRDTNFNHQQEPSDVTVADPTFEELNLFRVPDDWRMERSVERGPLYLQQPELQPAVPEPPRPPEPSRLPNKQEYRPRHLFPKRIPHPRIFMQQPVWRQRIYSRCPRMPREEPSIYRLRPPCPPQAAMGRSSIPSLAFPQQPMASLRHLSEPSSSEESSPKPQVPASSGPSTPSDNEQTTSSLQFVVSEQQMAQTSEQDPWQIPQTSSVQEDLSGSQELDLTLLRQILNCPISTPLFPPPEVDCQLTPPTYQYSAPAAPCSPSLYAPLSLQEDTTLPSTALPPIHHFLQTSQSDDRWAVPGEQIRPSLNYRQTYLDPLLPPLPPLQPQSVLPQVPGAWQPSAHPLQYSMPPPTLPTYVPPSQVTATWLQRWCHSSWQYSVPQDPGPLFSHSPNSPFRIVVPARGMDASVTLTSEGQGSYPGSQDGGELVPVSGTVSMSGNCSDLNLPPPSEQLSLNLMQPRIDQMFRSISSQLEPLTSQNSEDQTSLLESMAGCLAPTAEMPNDTGSESCMDQTAGSSGISDSETSSLTDATVALQFQDEEQPSSASMEEEEGYSDAENQPLLLGNGENASPIDCYVRDEAENQEYANSAPCAENVSEFSVAASPSQTGQALGLDPFHHLSVSQPDSANGDDTGRKHVECCAGSNYGLLRWALTRKEPIVWPVLHKAPVALTPPPAEEITAEEVPSVGTLDPFLSSSSEVSHQPTHLETILNYPYSSFSSFKRKRIDVVMLSEYQQLSKMEKELGSEGSCTDQKGPHIQEMAPSGPSVNGAADPSMAVRSALTMPTTNAANLSLEGDNSAMAQPTVGPESHSLEGDNSAISEPTVGPESHPLEGDISIETTLTASSADHSLEGESSTTGFGRTSSPQSECTMDLSPYRHVPSFQHKCSRPSENADYPDASTSERTSEVPSKQSSQEAPILQEQNGTKPKFQRGSVGPLACEQRMEPVAVVERNSKPIQCPFSWLLPEAQRMQTPVLMPEVQAPPQGPDSGAGLADRDSALGPSKEKYMKCDGKEASPADKNPQLPTSDKDTGSAGKQKRCRNAGRQSVKLTKKRNGSPEGGDTQIPATRDDVSKCDADQGANSSVKDTSQSPSQSRYILDPDPYGKYVSHKHRKSGTSAGSLFEEISDKDIDSTAFGANVLFGDNLDASIQERETAYPGRLARASTKADPHGFPSEVHKQPHTAVKDSSSSGQERSQGTLIKLLFGPEEETNESSPPTDVDSKTSAVTKPTASSASHSVEGENSAASTDHPSPQSECTMDLGPYRHLLSFRHKRTRRSQAGTQPSQLPKKDDPSVTSHAVDPSSSSESIVSSGLDSSLQSSSPRDPHASEPFYPHDAKPLKGTDEFQSEVISEPNSQQQAPSSATVFEQNSQEQALSSAAVFEQNSQQQAPSPATVFEQNSQEQVLSSATVFEQNSQEQALSPVTVFEQNSQEQVLSSATVFEQNSQEQVLSSSTVFEQNSQEQVLSSAAIFEQTSQEQVLSSAAIFEQNSQEEVLSPVTVFEQNSQEQVLSSATVFEQNSQEQALSSATVFEQNSQEQVLSSVAIFEQNSQEQALSSVTVFEQNSQEQVLSSVTVFEQNSQEQVLSSAAVFEQNSQEQVLSSATVFEQTSQEQVLSSVTVFEQNSQEQLLSPVTVFEQNSQEQVLSPVTVFEKNSQEQALSSATVFEKNSQEQVLSSAAVFEQNSQEQVLSSAAVFEQNSQEQVLSSVTVFEQNSQEQVLSPVTVFQQNSQEEVLSSATVFEQNSQEQVLSSATVFEQNSQEQVLSSATVSECLSASTTDIHESASKTTQAQTLSAFLRDFDALQSSPSEFLVGNGYVPTWIMPDENRLATESPEPSQKRNEQDIPEFSWESVPDFSTLSCSFTESAAQSYMESAACSSTEGAACFLGDAPGSVMETAASSSAQFHDSQELFAQDLLLHSKMADQCNVSCTEGNTPLMPLLWFPCLSSLEEQCGSGFYSLAASELRGFSEVDGGEVVLLGMENLQGNVSEQQNFWVEMPTSDHTAGEQLSQLQPGGSGSCSQSLEKCQQPPRRRKPFQCGTCRKRYRTNATLKEHQRLHTPREEFTCPVCQKVFKLKHSLTLHAQQHMPDHERFECLLCSRSFYWLSSLRRLSRCHVEPLLQCQICFKTFLLEKSLRWHMKIHTSDQRYLCERCGNTYKSLRVLRDHAKKKHCEKPSWACSDCGKTFVFCSILKKHMRVHTKEQPFQCKHCNKKFSWKSSCLRHSKEHAREQEETDYLSN